MLKKVITVFLGSMAAIWLSICLFVAIILVGVIVLVAGNAKGSIEHKSILHLCLKGEVTDREDTPSLEDVLAGDMEMPQNLADIMTALKKAANDDKIVGVYLDLDQSAMGLAMREELRTALANFKKSGKWIYAYADNYSQGDFYTAAIADDVVINPSGRAYVTGLSATVPFFKGALDKLGVDVQVIKVGTFKSAVEPFILTSMSEPARLQYDVMLGSMWKRYCKDIVADRGLAADSTAMLQRMAATPMLAYTADQLIGSGLITAKAYRYEAEKTMREKAGTDDELRLISPADYLGTSKLEAGIEKGGKHLAVVYAVGDIVDTGKGGIVGDEMAPMIIELAENDDVRGMVLRINSGGGSAFASEQIWASLEYFKSKGKPFVVSMGTVAASGGYYIASGADVIYADPMTITGSIGIFGMIPYAQKLLNDKLGITFSTVETEPNSVFPRMDAPLTPGQRAALEKNIREGYDLFVGRVAQGRHMSADSVRVIAEGRVWAGSRAKKIGLVDSLAGFEAAVNYAAKKAGVDADDVVSYPIVNAAPWEVLMNLNSVKTPATHTDVEAMPTLRRWIKTTNAAKGATEGIDVLLRMRSMGTVQAKMEDITVQ